MVYTKCTLRNFLVYIIISTVLTDLVYPSNQGDVCFIGEDVRGICVRREDCKAARSLPHLNYLCSSNDEPVVCCREYGRPENEQQNKRNKLVRNVVEFTENNSRGEQLVDPETIYDVKQEFEETKVSDRKKHSISITTYNRKQIKPDDYTRSPIAEPNHLRPSYVQEESNGAASKSGTSNIQSTDYYTQSRPQISNNRESTRPKHNPVINKHKENKEDYSGGVPAQPYFSHNAGSVSSENAGRPAQQKHQSSSHVHSDTPNTNKQSRPTERTRYYEKISSRPSTSSPWRDAPRPLIEDENGYPVPPPPTHRPKPALKRISEIKCKEYSDLVSETVAGLPLTTDPKPVEINIQKCNYNAHQLIVGGQNTSVGEFPHMAAVGFLDRQKRTIAWNCGGSLISEHFVLTAAHCTTSSLGSPSVVRLGEHNLRRGDDGAHPVDYIVKEVLRHPGYRPPVRYNDVALLRLSRSVVFTPQIRPACLNAKSTVSNDKTIATGWGRIEYAEDQSDVLLKVVLSIVSNQKCNELYQGESKTEVLSKGIVAQQICAGELSGGKDTCQGDSGGPIEITTQGNKCIHHIIGVTSFGKRCAQANAPGVYTRVSSYLTWIEGVVWPELVHAIQNSQENPHR